MANVITVLAMDVGNKRVGLASGNSIARLPHALPTLVRDNSFWERLSAIIIEENPGQIVVGLPKSLDGRETKQTLQTRDFVKELRQYSKLPVAYQDEALTSWQAENELEIKRKSYGKGDVDALSAVYILEDYFSVNFKEVSK